MAKSRSKSRSASPAKKKAAPKAATLKGKFTMSTEKANLLGALYVGGFGVSLYLSASFCFGSGGLVPYFAEDTLEGPSAAAWFARSFGAQLLALASGYYFAPKSELTTKIMAIGMLTMLPHIAMTAFPETPAAFNTPVPGMPSAPVTLFQVQTVIHALATAAVALAAF